MASSYDVIVIGGRCGGAATAYLLARKGYKVLVVDQAAFPSDTLSTHFIQVSGIERLKRWGLSADVEATGAPPIEIIQVSTDGMTVRGRVRTAAGHAAAGYCVRRAVFDKMLLDKAQHAGAEVRQGRALSLEWADGRVVGVRTRSRSGEAIERASVVVGADGMRSTIATQVKAATYETTPPLTCVYYSYFSGLACRWAEYYAKEGLGVGMWPTNDGLTCVSVCWPYGAFDKFRADVEGGVMRSLDAFECAGERARAASRVERFRGTADVSNFFRACQGPGWALVGDAGRHKDPITGHGMSDAFADAELLVDCIDAELRQDERFEGRGDYERARNAAAIEQYRFTCRVASLRTVPAENRSFLEAVAASEPLSDAYIGMFSGLIEPAEFTRRCADARLFGSGEDAAAVT
jgi:flavin-dependent dehydrogenase